MDFDKANLADALAQVRQEALNHPRLTTEQSIALGKRIKAGLREGASEEERQDAIEARNELVSSNLEMVLRVVSDLIPESLRGKEANLDLIQEGYNALISAAERYDPDKNLPFFPFAKQSVQWAVKDALSKIGPIRIDSKTKSDLARVAKAYLDLSSSLGREPTSEEIAKKSGDGITAEDVDRLNVLRQQLYGVDSLDASASEDSDRSEIDNIADSGESISESIDRDEKDELLHQAIDSLPDREKSIVIRCWGLYGHQKETYAAVGRDMGISRERVRQLDERASQMIKAYMEDHGIDG